MRKVIIGLESQVSVFNRVREVARCVDAGVQASEADYQLNFGTLEQLFRELTPERMRILQALLKAGGLHFRDLIVLSGRDYSELKQDLAVLVSHDLVTENETGLLSVPWDVVELNLTLLPERAKAA